MRDLSETADIDSVANMRPIGLIFGPLGSVICMGPRELRCDRCDRDRREIRYAVASRHVGVRQPERIRERETERASGFSCAIARAIVRSCDRWRGSSLSLSLYQHDDRSLTRARGRAA